GGRRLDHGGGRAGVPHRGCVGWRVRAAAGLRHAVPAPARDAADPPDPDEGAHAGDRLRPCRVAARVHRLAAWRGPLRTPGRDVVRLVADPLLAWAAPVRPARTAAAAHRPLTGSTRTYLKKEGPGHARAFFHVAGVSDRVRRPAG